MEGLGGSPRSPALSSSADESEEIILSEPSSGARELNSDDDFAYADDDIAVADYAGADSAEDETTEGEIEVDGAQLDLADWGINPTRPGELEEANSNCSSDSEARLPVAAWPVARDLSSLDAIDPGHSSVPAAIPPSLPQVHKAALPELGPQPTTVKNGIVSQPAQAVETASKQAPQKTNGGPAGPKPSRSAQTKRAPAPARPHSMSGCAVLFCWPLLLFNLLCGATDQEIECSNHKPRAASRKGRPGKR